MRTPKNFKRERFALELYAGKHPTDAYVIAGYARSAENARRLANSPDIRKRIGEMFAAERGYAEIEAMRARRERDIIAYSDHARYYEAVVDEHGKPTGRVKIKDFTQLPRELTAAIKTIRPTKLGWVIELFDKDSSLRAIEERVDPKIGPTSGLTVNVNQTVATQTLSIMTDDELDQLERLVEKASAARSDQSGEASPPG